MNLQKRRGVGKGDRILKMLSNILLELLLVGECFLVEIRCFEDHAVQFEGKSIHPMAWHVGLTRVNQNGVRCEIFCKSENLKFS